MKTFQNFMSEKASYYTVADFTRSLIEYDIDPAKYVYLRVVEQMMPQAAATTAAGNTNPDVQAVTAAVNGLIQKYGRTHPAVMNIAGNMQKEVQSLTAAMQQQQQQQQPAKPGMMPQQQQQPVPGQMPAPGQQPSGGVR